MSLCNLEKMKAKTFMVTSENVKNQNGYLGKKTRFLYLKSTAVDFYTDGWCMNVLVCCVCKRWVLMYIGTHVCMCVSVAVWRSYSNLRSSLIRSCPPCCCLNGIPCCPGALWVGWLGWLVREPQGSAYFHLAVLGLQVTATTPCCLFGLHV